MKKVLFISLITLSVLSCSKKEQFNGIEDQSQVAVRAETRATNTIHGKEAAITHFAKLLSLAVYENKEVREFLKTEAMKEFDMNTDVLYAAVKDNIIAGKTFRDILCSYSSEEVISEIEKSVPLLNILVPEIAIFDIYAYNMDCDDEEIPVAIPDENGMVLYLNGNFEVHIPNGELPDFHTFVVNENSRVVVNETTRGANEVYSFISPNYDKSRMEAVNTRVGIMTPSQVGSKAIQAFNYFYKDDSSINSRALQRDYIYYGLTPTNNNGALNHNVTEYINFMEVNPQAYFRITDQHTGATYDDPKIIAYQVSQKGKELTEAELINKMWSNASYDFRFEIHTADNSRPIVVYIPLKPHELWNFNYDVTYRHGTWFRKSKYTYTINPSKFTSKRINLMPYRISFGKWDLAKEGMERYVSIYEEDKSISYETTVEYEVTRFSSVKVDGGIKLGLGTSISGEISTGFNSATTKRELKRFTVKRTEEDDWLGTAKIYFYDPIIEERFGSNYIVKTYNTGSITFGISAQ